MEMTNELNKFLSYIHMGNSVYRIYYNESNIFIKNDVLVSFVYFTTSVISILTFIP